MPKTNCSLLRLSPNLARMSGKPQEDRNQEATVYMVSSSARDARRRADLVEIAGKSR